MIDSTYSTIESAPRDGTPVMLACDGHPEFDVHLMGWSKAKRRWEGQAFTVMRKVETWWDEKEPQPTHWKYPG